MNPVALLRLDDEPSRTGPAGHLTPEQRLDTFETMWDMLTDAERGFLEKLLDWRI